MRNTVQFTLQGESIELFKLLKLLKFAESGWQAKELIRLEHVGLNGVTAHELRKQVRVGDTVSIFDTDIVVVAGE